MIGRLICRLTLPDEVEPLSEDGGWEADWRSDHGEDDAGEALHKRLTTLLSGEVILVISDLFRRQCLIRHAESCAIQLLELHRGFLDGCQGK